MEKSLEEVSLRKLTWNKSHHRLNPNRKWAMSWVFCLRCVCRKWYHSLTEVLWFPPCHTVFFDWYIKGGGGMCCPVSGKVYIVLYNISYNRFYLRVQFKIQQISDVPNANVKNIKFWFQRGIHCAYIHLKINHTVLDTHLSCLGCLFIVDCSKIMINFLML